MVAFNKTPQRLIAVSCPGGMAAQFRVQVASGDASAPWMHVAAFRNLADAARCQAQLETAGKHTRLIACRALPTAA